MLKYIATDKIFKKFSDQKNEKKGGREKTENRNVLQQSKNCNSVPFFFFALNSNFGNVKYCFLLFAFILLLFSPKKISVIFC